ncbi:MAG: hypothetical protein H7095_04360 [Pseudopedobacter sp.]|nr:hypothetical protein [Deinococcales bacterium]
MPRATRSSSYTVLEQKRPHPNPFPGFRMGKAVERQGEGVPGQPQF